MKFKIGQLVRHEKTRDIGHIEHIDADFYGASQAFKDYNSQAGHVVGGSRATIRIGPTKDGIRDRLLVRWFTDYNNAGWLGCSYNDGKNIEVMEQNEA
jgi:hypothetical protein